MSADASATRTSGTTRSTGSRPAPATGAPARHPRSSPTPLRQHVARASTPARQAPECARDVRRSRVGCRAMLGSRFGRRGPARMTRPRHMAQPPRHSVPLYRRSHRLPHYQTDSRTGLTLGHIASRARRCLVRRPALRSSPSRRIPPTGSSGAAPAAPCAVFARLRQSASAGPCADGWTRPLVRRGSASEAGTRAHVRARRLFGWKVRLPLATAVISSCVLAPRRLRAASNNG